MLLGDAAWFPNYGDYLALPGGGGGYQAENVIKVGPNRYWASSAQTKLPHFKDGKRSSAKDMWRPGVVSEQMIFPGTKVFR